MPMFAIGGALLGASIYSTNKANKNAKAAANAQQAGIEAATPQLIKASEQAQRTLNPIINVGESVLGDKYYMTPTYGGNTAAPLGQVYTAGNVNSPNQLSSPYSATNQYSSPYAKTGNTLLPFGSLVSPTGRQVNTPNSSAAPGSTLDFLQKFTAAVDKMGSGPMKQYGVENNQITDSSSTYQMPQGQNAVAQTEGPQITTQGTQQFAQPQGTPQFSTQVGPQPGSPVFTPGLITQGEMLRGQQTAAIQGANQMQQGIGMGMSNLAAQQGRLDVNQFLDPSMAFEMAQGQKALDASAASRGLALSGGAIKNALEYSQGLASKNYNNAVTQAIANRGQQIGLGSDLAQLGSLGQSNNQNMATTGYQGAFQIYGSGVNAIRDQAAMQENLGANIASQYQSAGNAKAAGIASQRDPLGAALGQVANAGINAGVAKLMCDEDMKRDIESISDEQIDAFLNKLNPAQFDYVEDAIEQGAPEDRTTGVMAQDMQKSKIGKTLVSENAHGTKVVDVPKTVGALLAATASINRRLNKVEGKK